MDLDTALTSLYEASREEFIPARDDLVKQARSAGDRELAGRIAAARKPTVAAWLLNQVGREYPDDLSALAELSDALRGAHQQLAADRLRALSQQRNELLRILEDRVLRVARRAKMAVTDQVAEQAREAFTAAVLDPGVLASLRTGRLSAVPGADANAGWPTWDGIPDTAPDRPTRDGARDSAPDRPTRPTPAPTKSAKSTKDDEAARRRALAERRAARRREAEDEAELAESARAEAQAALDEAKQRAEEADTELAAARSRVEQARFEQRTAKQAAAAAQQEYDQAERNARAAQRALADLR